MAPPSFPSGAGYVPDGGFEPVLRSARFMSTMLGFIVALQILLIPSEFHLRNQARRYLDGEIGLETLKSAIRREQSIAGAQSAFTIVVAITTVVWMRKMIRNHRRLGRPGSKWSPTWGLTGWLVPPGAIYAVPWLIFKELWRGSDPANLPNDPNWKTRPVTPLIHVWWVLFGFVPILSAVLSPRFTLGLSAQVDARDVAKFYTDQFWVQLLITAAGLVSAVIYGWMVRKLSERQTALWDRY